MPNSRSDLEKVTHAVIPVEPPLGVLVSMALCLDQNFGLLPKKARDARLQEMRKLYDEVVGQGYYQQDRDGFYKAVVSLESAPCIAALLRKAGVAVPKRP